MKNRFDFEQEIMAAWTTKEDLDLIYHSQDILSEDELANALLGLSQIHQLRMERLWNTFETLINEGKIT